MDKERVDNLKQAFGPMSESDIEFLEDLKAFVSFAIDNGLSLAVVLSTIGHDVNEITRSGLDLDAAKATGFLPKVTGYSQIDSDSIGEIEDAA